MTDDAELLRRYAEEKREDAFAELVRRHLGLVYHAALRQCGGDAHRAEDVAQSVFTDLALKAGQLKRHAVLAGWLFTSTRYAAAQAVRSEVRRQTREQEAHAMDEILAESASGADPTGDWEKLRPVIDDALHRLGARDREAVLLRFFEGRSFAEVGTRLNVSEDAARVRVGRALDKLHAALSERGVTSTTAALGLALAQQAGAAAPAGLEATVTGAALAGAGAGAATAVGGILAFMGTTKLVIGLSGAAALGLGAALLMSNRANEARAALAKATQEQSALSARLTDLESRTRTQIQRLKTAETENAKLLATAREQKSATTKPLVTEVEPITSGMVNARFRRAQALVREGDPAEALRELLWCYDVGMPQVTSMSAVRSSSGVGWLAKLGERYPPALAVLHERRDQARARMLSDENDYAATQEFAAINRALKDDLANVSLFDQLPAGDRRRRTLASSSYDFLVENQRYQAAADGRPYSQISSLFETMIQERPLPPNTPNPDERRREFRQLLVANTAKSIEMLAGSGDLANARALTQRLLAYDNSEATKALIQKHAERAGQPGLLAALATSRDDQP